MFAVIKTGGKQYRVAAEDVLRVERLEAEPGAVVEFAEVLVVGGDPPHLGTPTVAGATVAAEVLDHVRGDKVIAFKKRRRKNSRRKRGHRQQFSLVRITEILTEGRKPSQTPPPRPRRPAAPQGAAGATGEPPSRTRARGGPDGHHPTHAPPTVVPPPLYPHTPLPSVPTRRSSDLWRQGHSFQEASAQEFTAQARASPAILPGADHRDPDRGQKAIADAASAATAACGAAGRGGGDGRAPLPHPRPRRS